MTAAPIVLSTPSQSSRVTPPDLELWLTGFVRAIAQQDDVDIDVDNKERTDLVVPLARPLVIIRDDSGPRLSHVTFDRSVGVSVLAGSRMDDKTANDTARWLAGVMFDLELPNIAMPTGITSNPIVAVIPDGCLGPYPVTESLDVARRYFTAQYTVAGTY